MYWPLFTLLGHNLAVDINTDLLIFILVGGTVRSFYCRATLRDLEHMKYIKYRLPEGRRKTSLRKSKFLGMAKLCVRFFARQSWLG